MTIATDGNTFSPNTPQGMITDLEELNYDPEADGFAFLMRSKMWGNILDRRTSPHTAGTYDGEFLFPVNREDIAKGGGTMLRGFPVKRSSQVSNTRSKGASTDLTYVLAGIWKHLLIARIGVMEFAMSNSGDTNFATYQTSLRCVQFIDIAPRYENAFVLCDSIDMDLPA
jgi:HK97 family phage major capsid protein